MRFGRFLEKIYNKLSLLAVLKCLNSMEKRKQGMERCELLNFRYAKAAKRVAATIRARPFTAKELLVRHVEFAARFGNVAALDQDVRICIIYNSANEDYDAMRLL